MALDFTDWRVWEQLWQGSLQGGSAGEYHLHTEANLRLTLYGSNPDNVYITVRIGPAEKPTKIYSTSVLKQETFGQATLRALEEARGAGPTLHLDFCNLKEPSRIVQVPRSFQPLVIRTTVDSINLWYCCPSNAAKDTTRYRVVFVIGDPGSTSLGCDSIYVGDFDSDQGVVLVFLEVVL
jgi:hypothetical protein